MDDTTPEMEAMTDEMRELMRLWIANPDDAAIKARYSELQDAYQRAFMEYKQSGGEQPGGTEATHQAYS